MKLDHIDRQILSELQDDASLALEMLGERVGLSRNACWRRVKMLESSGIIAKRVAILDPDLIGRPITVFINMTVEREGNGLIENIAKEASLIPEVTAVYRMSGDNSYLLRAQVSSLADYDRLYRVLITRLDLVHASANFVLEKLKETTAIPV